MLQLNLGRLCNMRCSHCHVDAGPDQAHTQMPEAVVQQCLDAMERLKPELVDLTGGAPELRQLPPAGAPCPLPGLRVIDRFGDDVAAASPGRCNPLLGGAAGGDRGQPEHRLSTNAQHGDGTWQARSRPCSCSIAWAMGERAWPGAHLMSNPAGEELQQLTPCDEIRWRKTLAERGVTFNHLIGLNNMPIARFLLELEEQQRTTTYLQRLREAYNPCSVSG